MSRSFNSILSSATLSLAAFLAAMAFAGCNTFDPDLGPSPFRCGTGSPTCPDNYECVIHSAGVEICELIGDDVIDRPDAGDIGTFTCSDDSLLEPNNSITDPTLTSIPSLKVYTRLVQLAICPAGDQDFFRFDVEVGGTNALAEIEFDPVHGDLVVEMLNSSGVSISVGRPIGANEGIIRVAVANLAVGTYYALVRGDDALLRNNYKITIQTQ